MSTVLRFQISDVKTWHRHQASFVIFLIKVQSAPGADCTLITCCFFIQSFTSSAVENG